MAWARATKMFTVKKSSRSLNFSPNITWTSPVLHPHPLQNPLYSLCMHVFVCFKDKCLVSRAEPPPPHAALQATDAGPSMAALA